MIVCLYIRLSSADEDIKCKTESESVSNQRALLMRYLNSHSEFSGCEPVEFIDDGFSGVTGSRPAFERMIRFVRDGGSKVILVKDLSRFFRDYVEIGEYLERVFPALGVRLLSINDNYDSLRYKGTTAGLDVVLKCIVYSYYSRDLSRKTKSASNIRKKKGMFLGANAPYGFLKDPLDCHHLIPDPAASVTVREIFQLAVEGNTTGKIAKILNSRDIETPAQHFHRMFPESGKFKKGVSSEKGWTAMEIQRIIQRFEYTGAVVNNRRVRKGVDQLHEKINDKSEWIIVEGCHEAIISKETFETAQSCIIKKGPYVRKKQEYLLRGLVRCGCCKLAMPRIQIKKGIVHNYFRCYKTSGYKNTGCPSDEHFEEADLEKAVIAALSQMLETVIAEDRRIRKAVSKSQGTASNIRLSLGQLEIKIQKMSRAKLDCYEAYAEGNLSREAYIAEKNRLDKELETLKTERDSLKARLSDLEAAECKEVHETAEAGEKFLRGGDVSNEILKQFIECVYVYSGMRIEIVYRFNNPFINAISEITQGKMS